jgi:hypothetical protein
MKYDIEIPKSTFRTVLRTLLIVLALTGMAVIGYFNSPVGEDGRPLLLSPRLAQITRYQNHALRWSAELVEIHVGLQSLLEDQTADLLTQDGQASALYGQLLNLQAEVDGTSVPPTLEPLHNAVKTAVEQYTAAAFEIMKWISEPNSGNYDSAQEALTNAASTLDRLNQNPWIQGTP